jgi:hypothetical protein
MLHNNLTPIHDQLRRVVKHEKTINYLINDTLSLILGDHQENIHEKLL